MVTPPIPGYALFAAVCFFFVTCAVQNSTGSSRDDNQDSTGWQGSPDRCGTLNIIENCTFTIPACTWSIQYLNLPAPKSDWSTKIRRKCKWTLLTIFVPEFLTAHATAEFAMALEDMKRLRDNHLEDISIQLPSWFSVIPRFKRKKQNDTEATAKVEQARDGEGRTSGTKAAVIAWTLTHSYHANMGGFHLCIDKELSKNEIINQLTGNSLENALQQEKSVELFPLTTTQLASC
jgi:hypothetical protein